MASPAISEIPALDAAPRPRPERIVEVATRLFARDGYHAVGMRAIAEASGLRASSLYNHFPSKQKILHAISLSVTRDFVERQRPLFEGEGSRAERLLRLFREHILFFWERREAMRVMLSELGNLEPRDLDEVQAIRRAHQHRIRDCIAEGVAGGEFHVDDPAVTTLAILDMVNAIPLNRWFQPGQPLSVEDLAVAYARLIVENLLGAGRRTPAAERRETRDT